MTFKHHDLKIWPEFYADLIAGRKPFELRKNDRDFEVGDELDLHEYNPKTQEFTGCVTVRTISYILGHRPDAGCAATFGIQPGYVILGLSPCEVQSDAVSALVKAAEDVCAYDYADNTCPELQHDIETLRLSIVSISGAAQQPAVQTEYDARRDVAIWMIENSYVTGHGDTLDDLFKELVTQAQQAVVGAAQASPGRLGCRRCGGWGRIPGSMPTEVLCTLCNGSGDDPDQCSAAQQPAVRSAAPTLDQIANIVSDYYDEDDAGRWKRCAQHIVDSLLLGAAQTVPPSLLDALASCKGEHSKFEAWAASKKYDMSEHPIHYLFTDPQTYAARQGWKAALEYVASTLPSADCGGGK